MPVIDAPQSLTGPCLPGLFLALTILERSSIIVSMNKLGEEKRAAVVRALVEGSSMRSTVRMTGVAKNTIV